ncbi:unnamed protein product [Clonostachys chloroleuca]|uniref:MYND-type domain-containing protein n=1 Tax=Clonostachys chloroleuca TaxID=1926264 RepID=A0AA35QBK5_9HYPO|nr:unnamed protein product [Clonostachys chloroleuca]
MENEDYPSPTGHKRLPDSCVDGQRACENCYEPGASMVCANCKVTDIGNICTRYCSQRCQQENWEDHKKVCHDRRRLMRAARAFILIWDEFQALTYDRDYNFVRSDDDRRVIHIGFPDLRGVLDYGGWTGETIFRPFLGSAVPGNVDTDIKRAILHRNKCTEVVDIGRPLIDSIFKPLCTRMLVASVEPKDIAMVTVSKHVSPMSDAHDILYLELASGDGFALDVSGCQYGWQESIYTWDCFLRHRARLFSYTSLDDVNRSLAQNMEELRLAPTDAGRASRELRHEIVQQVAESIKAFFRTRQTSVRSFMSAGNDSFSDKVADLTFHATVKIQESIHHMTANRGLGRWYLDIENFGLRRMVLRDEELAQKMRRVFLAKEDIASARLKYTDEPQEIAEKKQVKEVVRLWNERVREYGCLS